MNVEKFREKMKELDMLIPRAKWFEIPIDFKLISYFRCFGLYALYSKNKVIYIGISEIIRDRLEVHLKSRKFNRDKIDRIKIKLSLKSWSYLEYIENKLIFRLRPKYNRQVQSEIYLKSRNREIKEKLRME